MALDDPFNVLSQNKDWKIPNVSQFYYQDLNTIFPNNPEDSIVIDAEAINNQIVNLFSTIPGERPFEPEFGSRIPRLLFKPVNLRTAFEIKHAAFSAIDRWMSTRIKLDKNKTNIEPVPTEETFYVVIYYTILYTGVTNSLVFSLRR